MRGPLCCKLLRADCRCGCPRISAMRAQLSRNRHWLADGRALTRHMVCANAFVDSHAKIAANTFRPLQSDIALVRDEAARVEGIARWIGLATAWANHHPAPGTLPTRTRAVYLRDSEAARPRGRSAAGAKRQVELETGSGLGALGS